MSPIGAQMLARGQQKEHIVAVALASGIEIKSMESTSRTSASLLLEHLWRLRGLAAGSAAT